MSKKIRVIFEDGEDICCKHSLHTMIYVLRKIGSNNFEAINKLSNLRPNGRYLLSQEIYPELKNYMKEICEGWYINSQSDTDQKYLQLVEIKRALDLNIIVYKPSEGYRVTKQSISFGHQTKPKRSLRVKFNDIVIEEDSFKDVFIECIEYLGAARVSQKGLIFGRRGYFMQMVNDKTGQRHNVAEGYWMLMPHSTDNAIKMLTQIFRSLNINFEIEKI